MKRTREQMVPTPNDHIINAIPEPKAQGALQLSLISTLYFECLELIFSYTSSILILIHFIIVGWLYYRVTLTFCSIGFLFLMGVEYYVAGSQY